jgi:hypothetical protein
MAKKGIIVLDPGHGGTTKIGGSSANNATSVSGIPEKQITPEKYSTTHSWPSTRAPAWWSWSSST